MPYIGQRPATGEANSFKILDEISSFTLTFDGSSAGVVSVANDTITEREHRFVTGQRVTYNDGGGTAITGLSDGVYYIIVEDRHTFKLASSANNAAAGTAINLTGLGVGASHTLNVAFDGVNTKFKATHTNGTRAGISQSGQLMLSINGVIQEPHDNTDSPSTGYAADHTSTIIFSAAPASTDQFFGRLIATNAPTFDISDNIVDNFTGDGSTSTFTLSKTPPNNESVLVTIDGVVQYPDDTSAVRAYTVAENILSFVSAPGLAVEIQVRHIGFAGASSAGITGFYGRTGNAVLKSTDNIVLNNATASGTVQAANVTVTGDLTVNGTTTTLDTDLIGVDKLEVAANNTTVAAAITQTGSGDILNLYDGSSEVFTVKDGGNVGIGTDNPTGKVQIDTTSGGRALTLNAPTLGTYLTFETAHTAFADIGSEAGLLGSGSNVDMLSLNARGSRSISLRTNSTERLRITSGGVVEVKGGDQSFYNASAVDGAGNNVFFKTDGGSSNTAKAAVVGQNDGANTRAGRLLLNTSDSSGNLTERLRIDSSGRLLLGTTAAGSNGTADDLVVANNGSASDQAGITIRGGTSGRSQIFFSDGTSGEDEYRGMLRYDHSDNSMQIRTNAAERLRIDSSGRLLVGPTSTSTPSSVVVQGNSTGSTSYGLLRLTKGSTTPADGDALGLVAFGDGNHNTNAQISSKRDGGTWNSGSSHPTRLEFNTTANGNSGSTERLRITSDGKVRVPDNGKFTVGTGDDLQLYHSSGDSHITNSVGNLNVINSVNGWIRLQPKDGEEGVIVKYDGAVELYHNNVKKLETESAGVAIHEDTDKVIRFTGSIGEIGNVTGFQATNTAASALTSFGIRATDIRLATGSSERLRIDSTGRVLISGQSTLTSTSLTHRLQVKSQNDANAIAIIGRNGDDIGELSYYEADKSTKLGEVQYRQDHANIRHRVGYISFATGGTTERLRITSNGAVLVGGVTSDNGFKLKVSDGGGYEFAFGPNDSGINSLVNYNRSGGAYVDCRLIQKELQLWSGTSPTERLRIRSNGDLILGPYDAPGAYTSAAKNVPYQIKVAPYGWQHHSELAAISMGNHSGSTGNDDGEIVFKTTQNAHSSTAGLVERLRIDSNGDAIFHGNPSIDATDVYYKNEYATGSWSSSSWYTVVPHGLTANCTYLVALVWDWNGSVGQPYYLATQQLYSTVNGTNGTGSENEVTPMCITHTGGTGARINCRVIAQASGTPAMQVNLSFTTGGNSWIRVKVWKMLFANRSS